MGQLDIRCRKGYVWDEHTPGNSDMSLCHVENYYYRLNSPTKMHRLGKVSKRRKFQVVSTDVD